MAQLNRSISFVAVAAAAAVAAVAAVASLDGLAAASRDYRSLGLFLKFFLCCSRQSHFCSFFSHVCPRPELDRRQRQPKKIIFFSQKNIIFFVGVFW